MILYCNIFVEFCKEIFVRISVTDRKAAVRYEVVK